MEENNGGKKNKKAFTKSLGKVISPGDKENNWEKIIAHWGTFIEDQSIKGLVPLIITGSGTSMDAKISVESGSVSSEEEKIPGILGIIDYLRDTYEIKKRANKFKKVDQLLEINELFKRYALTAKNKPDRVIIANLLNAFQENEELNVIVWREFNDWLLDRILKALPTPFHENLAKLYGIVNAISITLNFDGLLIRHFVKEEKRAFSLPNKKDLEKFFLRMGNETTAPGKEYIEIQIRGDILYVKCNSKQFCPNNSADAKHSLWANVASIYDKMKKTSGINPNEFLKCPYCGEKGSSYLSFPGSYEKEKDMRQILEVIWRYLAFRISCVTVVGLSGEWDPLIVAFLGDLLSERDIPLMVVDKNAKNHSYIIKELVIPGIHSSIALEDSADHFSDELVNAINKYHLSNLDPSKKDIKYNDAPSNDEFWFDKVKKDEIRVSINREFSEFENDVRKSIRETIKMQNFAQIGLKSYWMGLLKTDLARHNRLNHSIGVMKIASFLYEKAMKNSKLEESSSEKQFLKIAALLHDVGHLPFSHLIENVFDELGWAPGGYQNTYSHTYQTQNNIDELFEKNETLKNHLKEIGYSVKDVKNLVNGCFGVGFLDAIINSPIDADKIDYIFRDTDSTGKKISLSPLSFLQDFTSEMFITPDKFLALPGNSAKAARDLLNTRLFLYNNLYLQPGVIVLEGIVKLLIKTYFVHILSDEDIALISQKEVESQDMGRFKINYCIQKIMKVDVKEEETIEMKILENIFQTLMNKKDLFHPRFFDNLKKGYSLVKKEVMDETGLKKVETKIICKRFVCNDDSLKDIIKKVILRVPGEAIIETARPPNILSMADARKERERSDGTKQFAECILVPGGNPGIWGALNQAEVPLSDSLLKNKTGDDIPVYFYPLSGDIKDVNFVQCLNLFEKLLKESGISSTPGEEEM